MSFTAVPVRIKAERESVAVLLTTSLAVLIAQIDTSVVNLAAKAIGADFDVEVTELQWVVDGYNLVYASLLLTGGVLADLYGLRRLFTLGIIFFALGSLVCGLAPNTELLIGGRAICGLGSAFAVPTSLAILAAAYRDTKQRTRAIGLWASSYGIALVVGPTIGGLLVDTIGWRSIFLLIVPLCCVTLLLAYWSVRESTNPGGRRLDLPGQALAVAALGSLCLAIIEGPRWGWASHASTVAFASAAMAALLFLVRQATSVSALVPLALLENRVFSASLAVAMAMTFGMYAMLFLTPLYLQAIRGTSALLAGLALLPLSLAFVIIARQSGRIANRYGPRLPMTAGMAMMGIGLALLALLARDDSLLLIEAAMVLMGCGLGLNTGPLNAVALAGVSAERSGTASGLLNTARMVGATLGVAVLGTALAGPAAAGADSASALAPAYLVGSAGELFGALLAFIFVGRTSLQRPTH